MRLSFLAGPEKCGDPMRVIHPVRWPLVAGPVAAGRGWLRSNGNGDDDLQRAHGSISGKKPIRHRNGLWER